MLGEDKSPREREKVQSGRDGLAGEEERESRDTFMGQVKEFFNGETPEAPCNDPKASTGFNERGLLRPRGSSGGLLMWLAGMEGWVGHILVEQVGEGIQAKGNFLLKTGFWPEQRE